MKDHYDLVDKEGTLLHYLEKKSNSKIKTYANKADILELKKLNDYIEEKYPIYKPKELLKVFSIIQPIYNQRAQDEQTHQPSVPKMGS